MASGGVWRLSLLALETAVAWGASRHALIHKGAASATTSSCRALRLRGMAASARNPVFKAATPVGVLSAEGEVPRLRTLGSLTTRC
jgi:hypothetical protein